ncbi:threonine--tRNA ligase [Candidatus Nomurabacteria bacterium RIFCSPLOWO2_12_FULL_37_8]|uniref:Threonine--tRNA ligase n=1 Tax=Candidatus Nomurabacteria bacterium RIFCSPLOWO2_12_FULL_37_8 TaxID=1801793 RepID=A0A1F6Y7I4_9BACT|nr:MAG: threonine--tRNA ligase [Candidatus Nomurabacteria bacterium RIFCSPLOWO2_12_FULL_37_8]
MEKDSEMDKNDHRIIGKELDLFTFSPLVGPGLPLWTPKGTVLREELDKFVWQLRAKHGYEGVVIPHITKKELYETSGHWDKFSLELFRITSRENKEYALKPMNCPHHTQIFARKPHSYREMPQRYAETTMVYRDEQSGELGGLTRVLSITQDDSHVFCRTNQIKEEFLKIWDIVDIFYKTFGFTLRVRLSFRDPKEPIKYLGTKEIWDMAESELRKIAEERGENYFEGPGEAALYGPKLDFMAKNSAGREWQVATIQLDMNLPERFDLTCVNEKGEKERIVMIHSAITGSLERCAAVLIEHYEGNFPLWLSPVQVKVIPVRTNHNEYAKQIFDLLKENNIRVELDDADENLGSKVRNAKTSKIPYWIVVGDKEIEADKITLESREKGQLGQISKEELVKKLLEEIKEKK